MKPNLNKVASFELKLVRSVHESPLYHLQPYFKRQYCYSINYNQNPDILLSDLINIQYTFNSLQVVQPRQI